MDCPKRGLAVQKLIQGLQHYQTKQFASQRELVERLSQGQSPEALFITCSDSSINPNPLSPLSTRYAQIDRTHNCKEPTCEHTL
jgi:carbonic anhydrase